MTNGQDGDIARGFARFFHALGPASRRVRTGIAACALLVLGPALFVAIPSSGTSESACDALRRWALAYEGTSPTLDDVARFDRAHRVAIFNAISPTVRARLWQEQLRRFNRQSRLTDTQRALIAEGIALTTPALHEHDETAKQAFNQFWSRAESSFAAPSLKQGWYELGSVAPGFPSAKAAPSVWDRLSSPFRASANYGGCNCRPAPGDPWCPGSCVPGGCTIIGSGCGPEFLDMCTGRCS